MDVYPTGTSFCLYSDSHDKSSEKYVWTVYDSSLRTPAPFFSPIAIIICKFVMAGQPPNSAGAPANRPTTNGNTTNGTIAVPPQQRSNEPQIGGNASAQGGGMSQSNLNSIVRTLFLQLKPRDRARSSSPITHRQAFSFLIAMNLSFSIIRASHCFLLPLSSTYHISCTAPLGNGIIQRRP